MQHLKADIGKQTLGAKLQVQRYMRTDVQSRTRAQCAMDAVFSLEPELQA